MITVVHINTERTWRGGEAQVLHLASGLPPERFRSIIAAPRKSALLDRAAAAGVPVYAISGTSELSPRLLWDLWRIAKRFRPVLFHVHTSHGLLAAAAVRDICSHPYAVVYSRRTDFRLRTSFMSLSRRKYLWGADHIITVSEKIRDILIEEGLPRTRITAVHSGIDLDRFQPGVNREKVRTELHLAPDQPLIGMVAALVPHKDPLTFVRAAAACKRKDAVFVIAGSGKLWDTVAAEIKIAGLDGRFHLLGFRTDIPDILAAMDIYCMSSNEEGLGTSILDAMAMALPVVATRAGGIPEAVIDGITGKLVDKGDHNAMARILDSLISDQENAAAMGIEGRRRIESNFRIDITIARTAEIYGDILEDQHATG